MHRPVTHHPRRPLARARRRATGSDRHPDHHASESSRPPGEAGGKQVRNAWMAAARVRKAMQARIVHAFRRHLAGLGPGPSEEELLAFARVAVAEERLMRRLA